MINSNPALQDSLFVRISLFFPYIFHGIFMEKNTEENFPTRT